MEEADRELIAALRERLQRRADLEQAEAMQAYMKCAMPFAGVRAHEDALSPMSRREALKHLGETSTG